MGKNKHKFNKSNVNFNDLKTITLVKDLNGLECGWTFTRESKDDLFTFEYENKTDREYTKTSYSLSQKALEKIYKDDRRSFLFKEWFENEKTVDTVNDFSTWAKEGYKEDEESNHKLIDELRNAVVDYTNGWKSEYIRVKNQKTDAMKWFKDSEIKYSNLKTEISNLIKKYEDRYKIIDVIDDAEYDIIEEATVLENLITVLKHLRDFK